VEENIYRICLFSSYAFALAIIPYCCPLLMLMLPSAAAAAAASSSSLTEGCSLSLDPQLKGLSDLRHHPPGQATSF
jgi:hypothetical protein